MVLQQKLEVGGGTSGDTAELESLFQFSEKIIIKKKSKRYFIGFQ